METSASSTASVQAQAKTVARNIEETFKPDEDRIGRQEHIPDYFDDVTECPIDLTEDVLRHCGGRLTINDARLLYSASMHIKAKNILEVGSFDG